MSTHFNKEDKQMANYHIKTCLTWLAIKEIQIKITMRHYFRPARMGILNKTGNNKCWWGWELEPSYVPGRNVKWCSHFGK